MQCVMVRIENDTDEYSLPFGDNLFILVFRFATASVIACIYAQHGLNHQSHCNIDPTQNP